MPMYTGYKHMPLHTMYMLNSASCPYVHVLHCSAPILCRLESDTIATCALHLYIDFVQVTSYQRCRFDSSLTKCCKVMDNTTLIMNTYICHYTTGHVLGILGTCSHSETGLYVVHILPSPVWLLCRNCAYLHKCIATAGLWSCIYIYALDLCII